MDDTEQNTPPRECTIKTCTEGGFVLTAYGAFGCTDAAFSNAADMLAWLTRQYAPFADVPAAEHTPTQEWSVHELMSLQEQGAELTSEDAERVAAYRHQYGLQYYWPSREDLLRSLTLAIARAGFGSANHSRSDPVTWAKLLLDEIDRQRTGAAKPTP